MKRNLWVIAMLLVASLSFCTSCTKPEKPTDEIPEQGLYLGIIGFNNDLYTLPLGMLNQNTKFGFESFVDGLTMENGTILYHAVNTAIDNLSAAASLTLSQKMLGLLPSRKTLSMFRLLPLLMALTRLLICFLIILLGQNILLLLIVVS